MNARPREPPLRRRVPLLIATASLALAAGCELIVPGTISTVRCTQEGAIGEPVCPGGTFCHAGECREGPPALGEACGDDVVCGPGDQCFDPSTIGFGDDRFCSRMCCSSADCGVGTGLVCAVAGPGKVCLPAELWSRDEPGQRFAGEPCEKSSECRSGACSGPGGYCVDACCSEAECAPFGAECAESGNGWTCRPAGAGSHGFLQVCDHDADCASGVCVPWADGKTRCAEPCCSSESCGKIKVVDVVKSVLCVPVRHGTAVVYACAAVAEGDADRAIGEPCDNAGQCRGGLCVEEDPTRADGTPGTGPAKVCSDVCCTDASCGAPHLFACVPTNDGTPPGPPGSGGQGFDLQCRRR